MTSAGPRENNWLRSREPGAVPETLLQSALAAIANSPVFVITRPLDPLEKQHPGSPGYPSVKCGYARAPRPESQYRVPSGAQGWPAIFCYLRPDSELQSSCP